MAVQQIQLRRDTAANWASSNPVLATGEAGYVTDTRRLKFGNGATAWNSLAYGPLTSADQGVYVVTDYGAVAGGDAAAATTSAIAAAEAAGGGIVYIPPGSWTWTSVPKIPDSLTGKLHIRGDAGTLITLTSGGPRFLDFDRTADYQTFQNIEISDFTIDVGGVSMPSSNHVVIGMQVTGSETSGQRVNVQDLTVRRITTLNVPVSSSDLRRNVWIISRHLGAGEGTQTSLKDILVEDCEFQGGSMGVVIAGTSAGTTCNVLIDNVTVRHIKHTLVTNPTSNWGASHVHIGSKGFGGSCLVQNIWGFGSRDVGIEINGMEHAVIDGADIENANGFYFVHASYNVPANPGSQQIEVSNLHAKWSGGTHTADASSAIAAIWVNSNPLGSLIVRDCSMYKSTDEHNNDGQAIKITGEMKRLLVENFEYVDDSVDVSTAGAVNQLCYLVPSNLTPVTFRNVRLRLAGALSGSGTAAQFTGFTCYGSFGALTFDNCSVTFNGLATGSTGIRGWNLGQQSGTVIDTLSFNRCRCVIDTTTNAAAMRVYGDALFTLNKQMILSDCDFSGMASTAGTLQYMTGTEKQEKTVHRNTTLAGGAIYGKGTAAPSTGNWLVGDKVENTAPTAGGNIGWVCTTAGTPGTWKTYGTIAA